MTLGKWILEKLDPKHEELRQNMRDALETSSRKSQDFSRTMVLNAKEIKAAICQKQHS